MIGVQLWANVVPDERRVPFWLSFGNGDQDALRSMAALAGQLAC